MKDRNKIDMSGPYRVVKLSDGLYVVGNGERIHCESLDEADCYMQEFADAYKR